MLLGWLYCFGCLFFAYCSRPLGGGSVFFGFAVLLLVAFANLGLRLAFYLSEVLLDEGVGFFRRLRWCS